MMRKPMVVVNEKFCTAAEESVGGTAQILVWGHGAFNPGGKRWIFEKDDATIGACFVAEADHRFQTLPGKNLHGTPRKLSRRAVEWPVP
jgi:hypothetical protein